MGKSQFQIGDVYDPAIASQDTQTRRDTMESIAYKVEDTKYTKQLSQEEIADKKDELAEVSIELDELERKKKDLLAELKAEMEIPLQMKKELLNAIKYKVEQREGLLYKIDDQENGLMYIFDDKSECIEVRALRQDERQTKIKDIKSGTNG